MINIFSRGRNSPRLDISEILRGCDVGRMQSVGIMQVLPLVSDLEDARVVAPMSVKGSHLICTVRAFRPESRQTSMRKSSIAG